MNQRILSSWTTMRTQTASPTQYHRVRRILKIFKFFLKNREFQGDLVTWRWKSAKSLCCLVYPFFDIFSRRIKLTVIESFFNSVFPALGSGELCGGHSKLPAERLHLVLRLFALCANFHKGKIQPRSQSKFKMSLYTGWKKAQQEALCLNFISALVFKVPQTDLWPLHVSLSP